MIYSRRFLLSMAAVFILSAGHNLLVADKNSPKVRVSIENSPSGVHKLRGEFTISSSSATAWAVLGDYDQLASFVSSIKSCRVLERKENHVLVEQKMTGKAGIFQKSVFLELQIEESPPHKIAFTDIANKSFSHYSGSWVIRSTHEGIHVAYALDATPKFFAPDFIATGAFVKTVRHLMEEVRSEMLRREAHP